MPWVLAASLLILAIIVYYVWTTQVKKDLASIKTEPDFFNPNIFINSVPVNVPHSHASSHLKQNDFELSTRVRNSHVKDKARLDKAKNLLERICASEEVPDSVGQKKFKELSDAIKATPWEVILPGKTQPEQVNYEKLHNMHKLGVISQYLKEHVMKYDHEGKTTGMLVSEIFQTGKGACASMPILYTALCEYMGLSVSLVTIGDHSFARYHEDETWVNIELTVDGKSGVGVPDAAYLKDITADNYAYQRAVESGLDMRMLSLDEMTGLMYANKTSYLYKKHGYRNIDALWKAACFGVAYNPGDWMHAENWKKVRDMVMNKEQQRQIKDIKTELAKLEGKSNIPFGLKTNSFNNFRNDFNAETYNRQQRELLNPLNDQLIEEENLKHTIKKVENGYGTYQDKQNLQTMKHQLRSLQDPASRRGFGANQESDRKASRIKFLKFDLERLEAKQRILDRNSAARKQIESLRRSK